jgi:hypothetical protein
MISKKKFRERRVVFQDGEGEGGGEVDRRRGPRQR